ncbi:MAG: hypothetical protein E7330_05710 [Clostridiales bacterium]|nr:hypothetical protein [Clostridiales bacterium]
MWDSLEPLTAGGSVLTLTFEAKKEVDLDSVVSFKTDYDFILQDDNYQDIVIESGENVPESTPQGGETAAPEAIATPATETEIPEGGEETPSVPEATLEPTVPPASIVFESTDVKLEAGSELQLSPKLEGTDTTREPPTYYSSDESVATVDENGNVTAKGPGTATITAITTDGTASGEMTVTVEGEAVVETLDSEKTGMPAEAKWLLIAAAALILIALGAFLSLKKKA